MQIVFEIYYLLGYFEVKTPDQGVLCQFTQLVWMEHPTPTLCRADFHPFVHISSLMIKMQYVHTAFVTYL